MIASSSTRSVLFDVGGVLVDSHPDPLAVAALLGEETAAFARLVDQAIWAHRGEYDAGCSDRQFWDRVAGDCGLPEPSPATLKELVGLDTARMLDANPDVIELTRDLRRGGARLGIVSNAPYSVSRSIKESEWGSCFDFFVFSCDYGVCKPQRRIYRDALVQSGSNVHDVVFVDDRKVNVRAAELMGMSGILWTNPLDARQRLREFGYLL